MEDNFCAAEIDEDVLNAASLLLHRSYKIKREAEAEFDFEKRSELMLISWAMETTGDLVSNLFNNRLALPVTVEKLRNIVDVLTQSELSNT